MKLVVTTVFAFFIGASTSFAQCPTISVVGPTGVTQPGDPMTFRVDIQRSDVKFFWTVSAGTIVEGQGTTAIVVSTDNSMAGANVTATIDVSGLRPDCIRTRSESAPIDFGIVCDLVLDEWGGLKPNDVRSRLDNFFAELANNPLNRGVVVLHVNDNERFDSGNKRLKFVVKHARFRELDLNRIWFVLDQTGLMRTQVYRVPPGADMRPCAAICVTIKGGDL